MAFNNWVLTIVYCKTEIWMTHVLLASQLFIQLHKMYMLSMETAAR